MVRVVTRPWCAIGITPKELGFEVIPDHIEITRSVGRTLVRILPIQQLPKFRDLLAGDDALTVDLSIR